MTSNDADARRTSTVSTADKLRRLLWSIVQGTLYRFSFHTWNGWRAMLLRTFGAKIGRKVTLRRTSRVFYPWLFELGELSTLGDAAEVYNLGRIAIGNRVTVSQEAYLCAGTHDYTRADMALLSIPIVIEDDAWICARAFVHPGVTVHKGAILGACAVATHDLEAWKIYGGNPARAISDRPALTD
jgi:putative colanic acid biosynthesis acetyltransferase WcaF